MKLSLIYIKYMKIKVKIILKYKIINNLHYLMTKIKIWNKCHNN
jgi:hypothetical protein